MSPGAYSRSRWKVPRLSESLLTNTGPYVPFIALTETWLKPFVSDAQISIPQYNVIRADRISRSHGGALLYIHTDLPATNISVFSDEYCSSVICTLNSIDTIVASIYRPPDAPFSSFKAMMSAIQTYVTNANAVKQRATILAGDFNFPNIAWDTTTVTPFLSRDANSSAQFLLNFLQENFMSQYVSTPTRYNNILDLVISDSDRLIHHIVVEPTNLSDHDIVRVTLPFNPKAPPEPDIPSFDPNSFRSLDIHKANYDQINSHLEKTDWDSLKNSCSAADFPNLLYRTTFQACALFTPVKVVSPPELSKPARFRRTISRRKRKLNPRLKALQLHQPNSHAIQKLKYELNTIQLKMKESIYSQLKFQESKVIQSIKDNPRFFFSFAKQKSKVKSSIGPLLMQTGPSTQSTRAWLNFSSLNMPPSSAIQTKMPLLNPQFSQPLTDFSFTTDEVEKAIDEIDKNSSCGQNDIPATVLRQCRSNLSYPIYLIWEESLGEGKILSPQLKDQIISRIHKKGSRADPAEYRPILSRHKDL